MLSVQCSTKALKQNSTDSTLRQNKILNTIIITTNGNDKKVLIKKDHNNLVEKSMNLANILKKGLQYNIDNIRKDTFRNVEIPNQSTVNEIYETMIKLLFDDKGEILISL